jgi:hypothetical protein
LLAKPQQSRENSNTIVLTTPKQAWQQHLSNPAFRRMLIIGVTLILIILYIFPYFFQHIQNRHGKVISDPILGYLTPRDLSVPLFIVIWGISLLAIFRSIRNPRVLMTFIWAWIPITLCRFITITLFPLEPPAGLIGLIDPLSNHFYGPRFITKDLFFSGHTSTVFLIALSLPRKIDKNIGLLGTFMVAAMLLIQHVHYTLDIVFAFPFGYFFWWLSEKILLRNAYRKTPPRSAPKSTTTS